VVSRAVEVEAGALPTVSEKKRKPKPPPELPPVGCTQTAAATSPGIPIWVFGLLVWLRRLGLERASKMRCANETGERRLEDGRDCTIIAT
jgi:hypothetical protein